MDQKMWLSGAITLAILSFSGLYYTVTHLWPEPGVIFAGPHLFFFALMFLGLGSATIPLSAWLHHRFARPGWAERDRTRLLREGLWVGLFGVLLAYLQLIRALNWTLATVLAGVFILIETFFLTRE